MNFKVYNLNPFSYPATSVWIVERFGVEPPGVYYLTIKQIKWQSVLGITDKNDDNYAISWQGAETRVYTPKKTGSLFLVNPPKKLSKKPTLNLIQFRFSCC